MKKHLILITFLFTFTCTYSQNLDLIVLTNNDSIACKITDLTEKAAYYDMKIKNKWVSTYSTTETISSTQIMAIDPENSTFRKGTSILQYRSKKAKSKEWRLRRNSIYSELGGTAIFFSPLSYDRIFQISPRAYFVPRIGFGTYGEIYPIIEANFMFALDKTNPKHFIETGLGSPIESWVFIPFMRFGYRYQGKRGLMIRIAPIIDLSFHFQFWAGFSIGYSF